MRAIDILKYQHKVSTLCKVLKVNRSTYYNHLSAIVSKRSLENDKISNHILKIYLDSKKRFGAHKIRYVLEAEYGIKISVGRVYRLIKLLHLPKMSTYKPKIKYPSNHSTLENKTKRQFAVSKPNLVWCSDVTYIKTLVGFVYLCVIIDLFSRKVVSHTISSKQNSQLIINTLEKAIRTRNISMNLIFHSDRGSQYTSDETAKFCDCNNITRSFSGVGNPYDNAVAESFFKFLKHEEINRKSFKNLSHVKSAVFEYIEGFYNSKRPHSFNNMLPPNTKESLYFSKP